jgi:hypothetical protein
MPIEYHASLEWICEHAAILRLYEYEPGPDEQPPFIWSCTIKRIGPVAFLKGVKDCPPISAAKAIARSLREAGMKYREYERISWRGKRLVSKSNGVPDAQAD